MAEEDHEGQGRSESSNSGMLDLLAVLGAAITVLGLFSVYMQVVGMAKDTRNLILGAGAPSDGFSSGQIGMLFRDWLMLWLGASLGAIVFGIHFLVLAWWLRPSNPSHAFHIGKASRYAIWFVGGLFLFAGVTYIITGTLNELPAITD